MLMSQLNDVKVYNLSHGKSLPDWLTDRKKRQLLKQDVDLRRRIELIQDFNMPTASSNVKVTPDGQHILCTGVYKPRVKCFDVNQLSIKYDRCFDSEIVKFDILSEDFTKLIFLQADRYVEFHAQYGKYYRTRMPRFGRDLAYHKTSCDLLLVGDGHEVFRLNLELGHFMNPFVLKDLGCDINVVEVNPQHQLIATGTSTGLVECFDHRSNQSVGSLDVLATAGDMLKLDQFPAVTALTYKDGLRMAVGTDSGHILLYDIRTNKPYLVKDHLYGQAIKKIEFHDCSDNVLSCDSKVIRIWNEETGKSFTSIEPGVTVNDMAIYPRSGLIFLANEAEKNRCYYIPALGQAPKWCSFLDSITEELEESEEIVLYDDYKFVTQDDLDNLGLGHLRGTNVLRAYMHGYFVDMRLYHKAKSIMEPFAYEGYRKAKIQEKIEEQRASRIRLSKIPKINRHLAQKLLEEKPKKAPKKTPAAEEGATPDEEDEDGEDQRLVNPLMDDRFSAMFADKDFQVDEESDQYKLLHPVISKQEKQRQKKYKADYSSEEDDEYDSKPSKHAKEVAFDPVAVPKKKKKDNSDSADTSSTSKTETNKPTKKKDISLFEVNPSYSIPGTNAASMKDKSFKQLLGEVENHSLHQSKDTISYKEEEGVLGGKELTWKLGTSKTKETKDKQQEEHMSERKKARRHTKEIAKDLKTNENKYWRGKKVK